MRQWVIWWLLMKLIIRINYRSAALSAPLPLQPTPLPLIQILLLQQGTRLDHSLLILRPLTSKAMVCNHSLNGPLLLTSKVMAGNRNLNILHLLISKVMAGNRSLTGPYNLKDNTLSSKEKRLVRLFTRRFSLLLT